MFPLNVFIYLSIYFLISRDATCDICLVAEKAEAIGMDFKLVFAFLIMLC